MAALTNEKKIAKLKELGVELTGDENGVQLSELLAAHEEPDNTEDGVVKPIYTKSDKAKIARLTEAEVELTGLETPEELNQAIALLDSTPEEGNEETVRQPIPGVQDQLTPRSTLYRIANKDVSLPIYFVMEVKGGRAIYNHDGRLGEYAPKKLEDGSINPRYLRLPKIAEQFNAINRKNYLAA